MTISLTADDIETLRRKRDDDGPIDTVTITCNFDGRIDPVELHERIFETRSEYDRAWGPKHLISENPETGDQYWKILGLIFDLDDDGEPCDSSKFTIELNHTWMRGYLEPHPDTKAEHVLWLLEVLDREYGIAVNLPEDLSE